MGTGNLIGRVEKLRSLGIRAKKELPASFTHGIEKADSQDQEIPSFAEKDRESEKEKNELHSGYPRGAETIIGVNLKKDCYQSSSILTYSNHVFISVHPYPYTVCIAFPFKPGWSKTA